MKNQAVSLLIAALLLLTAILPAVAEEVPADFVFAGFDGPDSPRKWAENAFFTEMESRTGIRLAFRQYDTAAAWDAAKSEMLTKKGDLPDVLFKASLTRAEEQALYDAGVLIDLKPLIEANSPHLAQVLSDRPDVAETIRLPGGQIVSLPFLTGATSQNCMWINRKWLTQLKLDPPTDLEELEAVLRAFKERDPNMNGRADEVPLSFLGIFDLKFLSHAFGFIMNDYNLYERDGQAVFAPLTDEYLRMIGWLRQMYADQLLDQDGFFNSDSLRAVTSSSATQTYGVFFNPTLTNLVPSDWIADYALLMPLKADGVQRYRALWTNIIPGTFAVTSACADPGKALRWVDTLYTEAGAILASLGRENVDYVVDGDGTWRLTDRATNNSAYTAETLINSGSVPPGITADEFQTRYSDASIARIVKDTMTLNESCELPFPVLTLTDEQRAYVTPLQNSIGRAVDLQSSRWIIGEDAFDEASIAAFRQELDSLGLPGFMAFWQQILDDYKGE